MKTQIALVSVSLLAFPANAQTARSDTPQTGPYISVDIGGSRADADVGFVGLTAEAGGTPDTDLEHDLVVGFALGYHLPANFRAEAEVRRRSIDTDDDLLFGLNEANNLGTNGQPLQDLSGNTFVYDGNLRATTIMANVIYDFRNTGLPFVPYVKGGAGIAFNRARSEVDATLAVADQFGSDFNNVVYNSNTEEEFAWNVGGGFSLPVSDGAAIELEYLHSRLGDGRTQFDALGDAIGFEDIRTDEVTLGIRLRF